MPRLLVVLSIVLAALVAAGGAGSARLDDAADVTVRAGGNGQYEVTVQNTSTTLVINSFTFAPGPALTVSGVVRSDAGTCAMSGSTFSCSGLSLGIYHCGCNPGGLVTVTFNGAGDGAGSGVSGLGTSPAPPDTVAQATTTKTTTTTPLATTTVAHKVTTKTKKAPLCKKGQRSTKKKPCRIPKKK